ncbi:MAG TPA: CHAT domain-containing tetratricopeptide repeat protein [Chryseosolibacter sp.]|nr:CHAT domain-containing tetratricopeptide repeat protein [Chryseosolibacter sp.]
MSYEETMGQRFVFNEAYSKYVEEGDIILPDLLWETLGYTEDGEIEKVYNQYKRRITSDLLADWITKAKEIAQEGDYDKSGLYMAHLSALARLHGDKSLEAESTYYLALIRYAVEKYDEATPLLKHAADLFEKNKDVTKAALAFYYLGYCTNTLGQIDEAIQYHTRALEFREQIYKTDGSRASVQEELYTSLNALGGIVLNKGDYQNAILYYDRALNVAVDAANKSWQASCRWNLGYAYGDGLSQPAQSIPYYLKAIELYDGLNDSASVVQILRNVALQYNLLKDFESSFRASERAMLLAKKVNDPTSIALITYLTASTYKERGDATLAIRYFEEAENAYTLADNVTEVISIKEKAAGLYVELGQFDRAIKKHEERLLLATDPATKADAYWEMAYIKGENQDDHTGAIDSYKKCAEVYASLNDTTNLNTIYANIGFDYRDLNDSTSAYLYHKKGIDLTSSGANLNRKAYAFDRAAKTYSHFGNYTAALALYDKAFGIYRDLGQHKDAAVIAEAMGEASNKSKAFERAAAFFKDAIALYNRAADKANEAETYWDYAFTLGNNLRRYREGIDNYHIAYTLYMQIPDSVNASVMLSNIGQTYWSLVDYDSAIGYHRKAIHLASKSKNMKQVAKSWSKLATLYTESNNPVGTFEALKNSVIALEVLNDSVELANTYNEIANSYVKAKKYTEAFSSFEKALAIRKAGKDQSLASSTLYDMAWAYYDKADFKNAEKLYSQSYNIRKAINDEEGQVYALANLGLIEQSVNADYKKAEAHLNEAIAIAKKIQDDYILAYCLARLKGIYRSLGRSAEADALNENVLSLYRKNQRWKEVANTLVDIGYDAHYVYADLKKAMSYFDQAQQMADTLNDKLVQAGIYSAKSSAFRETGEFENAKRMAENSLKLYRDVENYWGLAGTYIDLGNTYKQMSVYDSSIFYQHKADSLYQTLGLEYARLAPLANLGENYVSQGDYRKGLEYYTQSLQIMQKAGDLNENLAIIKACIGEAHFYLNDYTQAERWLTESLEVCEKIGAKRAKADNLSVMARLKIEEKKYPDALKYLNEGIAMSKASGMTVSYLTHILLLGKAHIEQQDFANAKAPLEECVKLSRSIGKQSTLWESLYLLGVWYKNAGDLKVAKEHLKESVAVIEKIRNKVSGGEEARKLFSSDKQIVKVYDVLIDVLLQLGETEEAMNYLQKNNEDNLKAKFKALDVKFENEDRRRALEEERSMKLKLDGLEAQIAKEKSIAGSSQNVEKLKTLEGIKTIAESEYLKFINQQINVQPELSRYFNNSVQPTQFRKLKKYIPADMALLSYLVGENQVYIFVATTDTVIAKIVTVPASSISKNVNAALNIAKNHLGAFPSIGLKHSEEERRTFVKAPVQQDQYVRPFEELYHYLINPVSAEIAGKKRLGIIPTGTLNYIPFQLLAKTVNGNKVSLLANQFSIFYTSSTDMLFRLVEDETQAINILAFGNPDKTLPSTEVEVNDIKTVFPNTTVFVRDEATEDKAKFAAEEFNVMHFATHGNLDYEDFSQSFLTMAGNPEMGEDGRLTLEELWGMDVMNHLNIVVLSACQTAVTKGSHESSPVSPASGFLQNGVKSVIATLWKVDDEATSILVSDFYRNLKSMDAVDALRSAQVSLSQQPKYSHPYYWAGIVLLGDWR